MTDQPTSDSELVAACPSLTVWMYKDLARLAYLPKLPIALLYEIQPGYGHWVGIFETPEGIEHFDSYGLLPDEELKFVPRRYRKAFAATAPHLVRLLAGTGRPVNYNQHRLQSRKSDIATCGRWVVARCRNSNLTTDEFARKIKKLARMLKMTPDQAVVIMMLCPGGSLLDNVR